MIFKKLLNNFPLINSVCEQYASFRKCSGIIYATNGHFPKVATLRSFDRYNYRRLVRWRIVAAIMIITGAENSFM